MNRRILPGLITLGTFVLVLLASKYLPYDAGVLESQAAADQPIPMPANLTEILITLGLKDKTAAAWDGEISLSAGKVLAIDVVQGNPTGPANGAKFSVRSVVAKKGKGAVTHPVLRVTLDAPAAAKVTIKTGNGDVEILMRDLPDTGAAQLYLQDQVSVAREDVALPLTPPGTESDYPAMARGPDGVLWLAYCDYHLGTPYLKERVLAGNFDALVPKGNGDQIRLKSYDGTTWSAALDVTEAGLDIWRPAVTVAGGRIHVSWSQQVNGNWDIFHRVYTPTQKPREAEAPKPREGEAPKTREGEVPAEQGKWSGIARLSNDPGTDYNVASVADSTGQVWVAWQAKRRGNFQIHGRKLGFSAKTNEVTLTEAEFPITRAKANHWNPALAADSAGKVFLGYDTYARDNYDVHVAELTALDKAAIAVASSDRFEARVSLACDKNDRLWIAYEEGDEQWGKDYSSYLYEKIGFKGNPGNALYLQRTVRVKCLADGKVMEPAADLQAALKSDSAHNRSLPRLGLDGAGSLWLLYRHHPKPQGIGEVWNSYATCLSGKEWSRPRRLPSSDNLMDNRPALAPQGQGLMVVFSGDARKTQMARKHDRLYASLLLGGVRSAGFSPLQSGLKPALRTLAVVHPNESADVARMRAYRMEHQGKKLRLLRGEFHRHTEYTAHRDGDGLLEDSWRYALDAGNLDWMGNADHDNGYHDEYSWWQIQKMADLMHDPPTFVAAQSYERSVVYPNGHRNVMFPRRGIRPMPRGGLPGTEENGSADTKTLYLYLKHFKAICSSHTSATGMGTDWRDNDPVVEPIVEIYQGHRHNYEFAGAPRSATAKTQIGGYQPKGFVNLALAKGYKLGFQSSSDHMSTHISYGVVLTDDISRQGIIDAFQRRHCYAATDNIIVEFRAGNHIMGDIFETARPPAFSVKVVGTAPVSKVSILRDSKYVHVAEPNKKEIDLTFTDPNPIMDTSSYYYVRVEQSDGNLAWASPMWVTYQPNSRK